MQEIRFSSPIKKEEEKSAPVAATEAPEEKKAKSNSSGSKFIKTFVMVLGLILVVSGFVFGRDFVQGLMSKEKGEWSAVFLSNGQVYFGNIDSNNRREMVLKNVFYLQAEDGSSPEQSVDSLNQSRFKLVKLGQELHGPKDLLIINKDSVVFYEYLREDSKVVESIKSFK